MFPFRTGVERCPIYGGRNVYSKCIVIGNSKREKTGVTFISNVGHSRLELKIIILSDIYAHRYDESVIKIGLVIAKLSYIGGCWAAFRDEFSWTVSDAR
jgi:hypothetical protein